MDSLAAGVGGRWAARRSVSGEGVVVVAPLLEHLLLRLLRRGSGAAPPHRPNRLVSRAHSVAGVAYVADRTSVLLLRPAAAVEVLAAGALVLPALLARQTPTYVVVNHDPVEVWLRIGPFETLEGRPVEKVELRLEVSLSDSPSQLRDLLAESPAATSATLDELGDTVLHRLAREVAARTTEAVRSRTLRELTGLSLGVLLDQVLPETFLGGLLARSGLEVVDVDWPTEGRGWPTSSVTVPGGVAGRATSGPR